MLQQDMTISILEQIHDGRTHPGEYLSSIFKGSNILVWWKDTNSIWQGANHLLTHFLDRSHPEELIGKHDLDLSPCDLAELYIANDQEVIKSGTPKFNIIEPDEHKAGERFLLNVTKMPVYNNAQIVGTIGFASIVQPSLDYCLAASYLENFCQTFQFGKNYFILTRDKTVRLTTRQAECLTYLSMGKTIKQIANILNCSSANIQDHIIYLKRKLNVCTTAALIDCFWCNPIRWF